MKSNRTLQEELWIHRYPTGTIFRWTSKRGKPLFRFVGATKDAMDNDRVILVVEKLMDRTYHAVVNDIKPSEYEIVHWM